MNAHGWKGTLEEAVDFCAREYGPSGFPVMTCGAHKLLMRDQYVLDRLLFARCGAKQNSRARRHSPLRRPSRPEVAAAPRFRSYLPGVVLDPRRTTRNHARRSATTSTDFYGRWL
jgi:hypothetical protein